MMPEYRFPKYYGQEYLLKNGLFLALLGVMADLSHY